jgi:hypothetical protein
LFLYIINGPAGKALLPSTNDLGGKLLWLCKYICLEKLVEIINNLEGVLYWKWLVSWSFSKECRNAYL